MRIDEQVRRCTTFLSVEVGEGRFSPRGTGFLVGEVFEGGYSVQFLVTARHVVDHSRRFGALWVRGVRQDGSTKLWKCPTDDWWMHPTTDVAVAPLAFDPWEFGLQFVPLDLFGNKSWRGERNLGIGDHVVASGLFADHFGQTRDTPLARFGRIALLPDAAIHIKANGEQPSMTFEAILVELASWGGQSGSPVFVYFTVDRDLFTGNVLSLQVPTPRLLGVLFGHYSVETQPGFPQNSGISIVVPCDAILEVLQSEVPFGYRERARAAAAEDLHRRRNEEGSGPPTSVEPNPA
jgi:hypothetical protein